MYIGIDVSKNTVDVASGCGRLRLTRVNPGQAAQALVEADVTLVVLEATGGYERPMVEALQDRGIPVAIVNPRQARSFADALGCRAKTDRIDAAMLARMGEALKPAATAPVTADRAKLQAITTRRRQLVAMLTQEKNRLQQTSDSCVLQSLKDSIQVLTRSLDAINDQLEELVRSDATVKALQKVKGVGPVLAISLAAFLPELGQLNRQAIAALAGVAPLDKQSGQWKGKSFCSGGRAAVRPALYMATLVATRHNHEIKAFYRRLIDAGKPPKVALVACMRKLLVHLNSVARQTRLQNT